MEEKEINEMGEELSIVEFDSNLVNNLIMNLKEFGESSRKNAHFMSVYTFQHDVKPTFCLGSC